MAHASWTWELLSLTGVPVAEVVVRSATVTRRLGPAQPSTATLTIDATTPGGRVLDSTAYLVRGWRRPPTGGSRTIRHAGPITGITATAGTDTHETIQATSADPFTILDNRLRASQVTYTTQTPRAIVNALVTAENTRATTHLRVAAGTAGPNRDRTYEVGKNVGEAIRQLAEVQDGFYYVVNPVDDGATVGELVLRYPDPGSTAGAARFEHGPGTIGSLTAVEASVLPPINRVTGFGAGDETDQLIVSEEDTASIAAYGLYESSVQHVDVSIEQTLRDHCTDALRPDPRRTLVVQVATAGSVFVPSPWDDFDVGDTVSIATRTDSPVNSYEGTAVVTEVTVSLDDQGNETLTGLQVVLPGA